MSDITDPLAWVERAEEDYEVAPRLCAASDHLPTARAFTRSNVLRSISKPCLWHAGRHSPEFMIWFCWRINAKMPELSFEWMPSS